MLRLILSFILSVGLSLSAFAAPNSNQNIDKEKLKKLRSAALQRGCDAPEKVRINTKKLSQLKKRPRLGQRMPFAMDSLSTTLDECKQNLKDKNYCQFGNIIIMNAAPVIVQSGRCDGSPTGTIAYKVKSFAPGLELLFTIDDFEDRYQTVVFFSDFHQTIAQVPVDQIVSCPLAWHSELVNENGSEIMNIKGIGKNYNPAPNQTLHAMINMWSINDWTDAELFFVDDVQPLNILAHETEHDVCCFVSFKDPNTGQLSNKLIGHQGAHWSLYYNTYGQLMYGANWRDEGNGEFYSIPPMRGTRPLDLYLWGLIPPSEVPPFFIVDTKSEPCTPTQETIDAIELNCADMSIGYGYKCKHDLQTCLKQFDLCLDPPYFRTEGLDCEPYNDAVVQSPAYIYAKGKKKTITVDNIIEAVGERYPDYKDSYKVTTQLFVLLTGGNLELEQATIDRLNKYRRLYSRHFYKVTGYRMRNVNTWDGTVDAPLWEWGGIDEWANDTELEGWEGVNLKAPLSLENSELQLDLKTSTSGIKAANLTLEGSLYNAYQVVMTVPLPNDGTPKLVQGKFVLEGESIKDEVTLPVYADGKKHNITVSPSYESLKKETCTNCIAMCKFDGKENEGWYNSCNDELIKADECKTEEGLTLCGPYCLGQGTSSEGWVDSCKTTIKGIYHTLTLYPVIDEIASQLSGPIKIDRIDLFTIADQVLEENKNKDGEKDYDGDSIINAFDNCPKVANPEQIDSNNDEVGDACEDFDSDGIPNALDNCPTVVNYLQQDEHTDGIGDACDPTYSSGCSIGRTSCLDLGIILGLLFFTIRRLSSTKANK